jgi:hypothetical protein
MAGKLNEDQLRNFLGELRRANLAERGRMNQVEMAANDFREGILGVVPGVAREEISIGVAHVQSVNVADVQNPTGNFTEASLILSCSSRRVHSDAHYRASLMQLTLVLRLHNRPEFILPKRGESAEYLGKRKINLWVS